MTITDANTEILNQLQQVVKSLNNDEYSKQVSILSGNTIGKHVRHIIEFYGCLQNGISINAIDYDARERNLSLETDVNYTTSFIDDVKHWLSFIKEDKMLQLNVCFSANSEEKINIETTFYRELAYNIEHAIHHMAIIKIAIGNDFKHITLPENFGVAYSTIKYQQTLCAQ